ncbi:MAG TPA: DUF4412 domain-containing protein [Nitrospiraceae bacterium]|nr:DUF4412 domain-containing protein [Nitrospiraceae bacterium]
MSQRLFAVIVLAGIFGAIPVGAAQLSRPQVEYSADSTIQSEEGTIQQHVYVTPTKERKEMLTGEGDGGIQIFRYDTKVMWILMPSEKMYMEHSIMGKGKGNDPSQWTYEDTVMGEETLNGMKVTKYKTIAASTDGKKYGGFSWRTKEGISIKQDLLYKEGNDKKRMMTELKNVMIGRQDPNLFEVPEGFTKFDMAGMMSGAMGNKMGREGMDQPPMDKPGSRNRPTVHQPGVNAPRGNAPVAPEPDPPVDEQSDLEKAGGMLKKMFGN